MNALKEKKENFFLFSQLCKKMEFLFLVWRGFLFLQCDIFWVGALFFLRFWKAPTSRKSPKEHYSKVSQNSNKTKQRKFIKQTKQKNLMVFAFIFKEFQELFIHMQILTFYFFFRFFAAELFRYINYLCIFCVLLQNGGREFFSCYSKYFI